MKMFAVSLLISFVFFVAHAYAEAGVEKLSPELRLLLKKEMNALDHGMHKLVQAYIAGDMSLVAHTAKEMENGFILKQSMSAAQKQELVNTLPEAFIQQDKRFHRYAGMLAHVAEEQHIDLVGFYYSKLLESCVACHSEYARERFQAFKSDTDAKDHHH